MFLCFYFSSAQDGNCLYSSISIVLVANSSLSCCLHALVCLELFLYSDFYVSHPIFASILDSHPGLCHSSSSLLSLSVSNKTFNSADLSDIVKKEAVKMCYDKVWSSFLCILALSSILKRSLDINYPVPCTF